LKLKNILEKIIKPAAPGPLPFFNEFYVVKAIEIIGDSPYIGRIKLSKELKLGESSSRTLIQHLKKFGIISISKKGCKLTNQGLKIYRNLKEKIVKKIEVPKSSLTVGEFNFGVLIKNASSYVQSGIEQRDAAVKVGAKGVTTLIFKNGKLFVPPFEECKTNEWLKDLKELYELFKPTENDVILICGADDIEIAEKGAIMAALTLIE
jgi:predicted transcriptional regulator